MAQKFEALEDMHCDFIRRQYIFFTGSSAAGTKVNISPRGMDTFRVIDARTVAYLDRTGSGNETAAHLKAGGPMTIMFCALAGAPLILRLYGQGRNHFRGSETYEKLIRAEFGGLEPPGARQIVCLEIDLVQTSCGWGVPLFDFKADRPNLDRWAADKGEVGIATYWKDKNQVSLDGLPTGIVEKNET